MKTFSFQELSPEEYAATKDSDYPQKNNYLHKMKTALSGSLYESVLASYCILHAFDDIVDDASLSKEDKKKLALCFKNELRDYANNCTQNNNAFFSHLWTSLKKNAPSFSINQNELEKYEKVIDTLSQTIEWKPRPHFATFDELNSFNKELFQSIAEVIGSLLFADVKDSEKRTQYKQEFFHLMLSMQYVNLLVDFDEDYRAGQCFFPVSDFSNAAKQAITPQLFSKYYAKGFEALQYVDEIFQPEKVGREQSQFLLGLRDIFLDLGTLHLKSLPLS